jgi:hypothetical protein
VVLEAARLFAPERLMADAGRRSGSRPLVRATAARSNTVRPQGRPRARRRAAAGRDERAARRLGRKRTDASRAGKASGAQPRRPRHAARPPPGKSPGSRAAQCPPQLRSLRVVSARFGRLHVAATTLQVRLTARPLAANKAVGAHDVWGACGGLVVVPASRACTRVRAAGTSWRAVHSEVKLMRCDAYNLPAAMDGKDVRPRDLLLQAGKGDMPTTSRCSVMMRPGRQNGSQGQTTTFDCWWC